MLKEDKTKGGILIKVLSNVDRLGTRNAFVLFLHETGAVGQGMINPPTPTPTPPPPPTIQSNLNLRFNKSHMPYWHQKCE